MEPDDVIVLDGGPAIGSEEPDGEAFEAVRTFHEVLLRYPLAAQAAFSALVAEGKAYADTPEGHDLLRRISRSKKAARLRIIWEVLTMSGMTEKPEGALPGVFLDKLARTLTVEGIEPLIARLFERRS